MRRVAKMRISHTAAVWLGTPIIITRIYQKLNNEVIEILWKLPKT